MTSTLKLSIYKIRRLSMQAKQNHVQHVPCPASVSSNVTCSSAFNLEAFHLRAKIPASATCKRAHALEVLMCQRDRQCHASTCTMASRRKWYAWHVIQQILVQRQCLFDHIDMEQFPFYLFNLPLVPNTAVAYCPCF